MCFIEILLLILSLICGTSISYLISYFNSNYYLMFIMIILIPMLYVLFLSLFCLYVLLITQGRKGGKYNRYFDHLVKNIDVILMHLLNIKVEFKGLEKLSKDEKYLIVANHRSNFDPLVLLRRLPSPLVMVSKPETFNFPFIGKLILAAGYISINREDPREGAKAIFRAKDLLKNKTASVVIFPEGTRNKTEEPLLEMHPGSFKPAKMTDSKVVVLSIKGTSNLNVKVFGKRQYVSVEVLDILDSTKYDSTVSLCDETKTLILNSF